MPAVSVVRYFVLFVIELGTRRVEVLGLTRNPSEAWLRIVARGATDVVEGRRMPPQHALLALRSRLAVLPRLPRASRRQWRQMRAPARAEPEPNAYAERFIGSIRRECLDRVIPLGERHLRRIVAQYVRHYNTERNHQGIDNRMIEPTIAANDGGAIQCRERFGGLPRFYHREPA